MAAATGNIGGAICTHWRVGDAFFMQVALGILVWLGLYLRENRLRGLIPLRTFKAVDSMRMLLWDT